MKPGWSIKGSGRVPNVTVGATALGAVLASGDVLEATVGTEPTGWIGVFLVVAAVATGLTLLAGLVTLLLATSDGMLTVPGVAVASLLTLTGTLLQAIWFIRGAQAIFPAATCEVFLVSLVVIGAAVLYGLRSLTSSFADLPAPPSPTPSPAMPPRRRRRSWRPSIRSPRPWAPLPPGLPTAARSRRSELLVQLDEMAIDLAPVAEAPAPQELRSSLL